MAGELGHITVVPNGNPCGCGNSGCVEKYASATAVAAMARNLNLGDLSALDVQRLAEQGNPRALAIWRSAGEHLGTALATLISVFNAPLYILGGGASAAWDYFAPAMFAGQRRRPLWRGEPAASPPALILPDRVAQLQQRRISPIQTN
jgi:glucokinase